MKPQKLFFFSVLLFALFPILPNSIKGLPVILFFLCSIYTYIKYNRTSKFNIKKVLFFSGIYIFYLVSLFYTENFISIDKTLSTRLSLIIIPISFGLFTTVIHQIEEQKFILFSKIFFYSALVYCFVVIYTILDLGYYSDKVNINEVFNRLTGNLFGIEQHPIYASILISIAIFLSGFKLIKTKNKYQKLLLIIGNIFLLFTLFFLSRKAVILAVIFAFLIFVLTNLKKVKLKNIIAICTVVFIGAIVATPVLKKRFNEVFHSITYSKISPDNSTSIRYGVYKCVIKTIKNNPIKGYGIGDVDDALQKCYATTSVVLVDGNYNSHNQYFGITLTNGIFGLIFFILFLAYNVKKAFQKEDKLFLVVTVFYIVTMFFENILERQSGVILFTFFICFFNFIKVTKSKPKIIEKETYHNRN